MKFSVQVDNLKALNEVIGSDCTGIRFGSEFCEWKISNLKSLETAFSVTIDNEKEFSLMTPHVSSKNLEKLSKQLEYLNNQKGIRIIVNDLGVLDLVEQFSHLKPHLGRQLITALGRCPWNQITEFKVDSIERGRVEKTFYKTSLNYEPTINSFKDNGVQGVDVDWIPKSFVYYDFLVENGLNYSVYLHLVPVTLTRRCHMARFLGIENFEKCSRPCISQAFRLRSEVLDLNLFLNGNTVFRLVEPTQKDINKLYKSKATEFVITVNPLTKIKNRIDINNLIQKLTPKLTFPFFH